ncbi:hypothetical protein GIB67_032484 [Kingdonia uniflora]|uniref:Uncharacterized protein n=1 Tax=Kingdonia uniflora TaxID=39325 RepID=A0A7J7L7Q6_9MAGN|nr:hypothetical protein GIB67_032484 [Kingdonia uniflora]
MVKRLRMRIRMWERSRLRKKARLEQFMAKHELEGKGIILVPLGSEYTFKDEPNEGNTVFRGQIRLGMRLPLRKLAKEAVKLASTDCRRLQVGYYIHPLLAKVLKPSGEVFAEKTVRPWNLSFLTVRFQAKMHNRRASRQRLIDDRFKEFEASISGRAPMDEGSDVEVLDIVNEAPLSMVLPAEEVPVSRRRRTIVTEDSDEEETVWGEGGNVGPSGDKVQNEDSRDSTESDRVEGVVSAKDRIRFHRFAAKLELSKLGAYLSPKGSSWDNPVNYIDTLHGASEDWVYSVFESLKTKRQRRKKVDSLLRDVPATPKLQKRKRGKGVSKGPKEMGGEEMPSNYQFVPRSRRGSKQVVPIPEVAGDTLKLRSRPVVAQTEKGKGPVVPEASKVQQSKSGQRKRRKVLGEDNTLEEDEEMMEVERQEQAAGKYASMVELWEDDRDEASKEIKKHMFLITIYGFLLWYFKISLKILRVSSCTNFLKILPTDAWVQTRSKAMKSIKEKLKQAKDNLNLSHGKEASLVSEVRKLKQDLRVLTESYNERLVLQRSRLEREWSAKLVACGRGK